MPYTNLPSSKLTALSLTLAVSTALAVACGTSTDDKSKNGSSAGDPGETSTSGSSTTGTTTGANGGEGEGASTGTSTGDGDGTTTGTSTGTTTGTSTGTIDEDAPMIPPGETPPVDTEPPALEDPTYMARELLGRPTDRSVDVNVILRGDSEAYFEYGTAPGQYDLTTAILNGEDGEPIEAVLTGLAPNTEHFYRLRHRAAGSDGDFLAAPEYSFHTQRARGESFTFVVQADPHLDEKSVNAVYTQTLSNELADDPDFLVDLGDVSMIDKCVIVGDEVCHLPHGPAETYAEVDARNLLHRASFGQISHSVPVFLTLGNHEGEAGWRLKGDPNTYPYWDIVARQHYYLNPSPNDFYTGSSVPDPHVGLRENFYAWEWGDALFLVLDAYGYSTGGSAWGYSLGDEQYAWFKKSLEESTASHKFVFIHQLVGGGMPGTPGSPEGRGGKMFADYFEWGGKNADGSEGFAQQRPGFDKPLRELMEDNGVSILFHGHDHLYAKEDVNNMVYLEVPQPSHPTTSVTANLAVDYGYGDAVSYSASGHVRVTVSPEETKVDYVRSYQPSAQNTSRVNGTVMHTFTTPAK